MTGSTGDNRTPRNGKLRIPLPFEDALRAATKVPADKLPKPKGKQPKSRK